MNSRKITMKQGKLYKGQDRAKQVYSFLLLEDVSLEIYFTKIVHILACYQNELELIINKTDFMFLYETCPEFKNDYNQLISINETR